jgi:hypothetical protein
MFPAALDAAPAPKRPPSRKFLKQGIESYIELIKKPGNMRSAAMQHDR